MKKQDLALAVILAVELLGCAARAPQKPAGLPAEASWVGTRKGGAFILIGPKDRDGWKVKVFDDHTGAIRADGLFTLRGGIGRAELSNSEVVSYDGHALHLADGALLAPKTAN
jgi:hypothetical protein